MARYKDIEGIGAESFRRLTGIQRTTFATMVAILKKAEAAKQARAGRGHRLILEDRLMMPLEYWREYRTYFHIGQSYGVSESVAYRNIRCVEDPLVSDGTFALPGKKARVSSEMHFEVVVVDGTESPIERPQKSNGNMTLERRSDIRSKHSLSSIIQRTA